MFNIGDKVRVIHSEYIGLDGVEGVVTVSNPNWVEVDFAPLQPIKAGTPNLPFYEDELEVINP